MNKKLLLVGAFLWMAFSAVAKPGGYAIVRVYDTNKYVGTGTGFLSMQIQIVYEDGTFEVVPLEPYSEKNSIPNLRKITEALNQMRQKGYLFVSSSMTGEQGNMMTEYLFEKLPYGIK